MALKEPDCGVESGKGQADSQETAQALHLPLMSWVTQLSGLFGNVRKSGVIHSKVPLASENP